MSSVGETEVVSQGPHETPAQLSHKAVGTLASNVFLVHPGFMIFKSAMHSLRSILYSRAPGEVAHQQQQQEQVAREQYAQYRPAKAATHSGQAGSPAALDSSPPGHLPGDATAGQNGPVGSEEPKEMTGHSQKDTVKQPVGHYGSSRQAPPYYYGCQQGIPEQFWSHPSAGGPAHPSVYNPYS